MSKPLQAKLEQLGLSPSEAGIYLILLRNGQPLGASAIAAQAEMARPSVYPAVTRLIDLGLVESEATYGSGFSAVSPERAMRSLVARRNDEFLQCKELANEVAEELKPVIASSSLTENIDPKFVEVLRDKRSVLDRFERLEGSVKHSVDTFVKPPHFNRNEQPKLENDLLAHGIRIRAIYEKSWEQDPGVKPFMASWIAAGEEGRVYDGRLPHKLIIFDSHDILMPLILPGGEMRALLVRHGELAETLILAFNLIWEKSKPVLIEPSAATGVVSRNGHSRRRRRKQLDP